MYYIVNSSNVLHKKKSARVSIGENENGRWGWRYPEWGWIGGTCGSRVGILIVLKKQKSWLQFISKLKNSNKNIFILIDTRFGPQQEREFERLWDGPVFFNSFSSNQRGLMVLFRDSLPINKDRVLWSCGLALKCLSILSIGQGIRTE